MRSRTQKKTRQHSLKTPGVFTLPIVTDNQDSTRAGPEKIITLPTATTCWASLVLTLQYQRRPKKSHITDRHNLLGTFFLTPQYQHRPSEPALALIMLKYMSCVIAGPVNTPHKKKKKERDTGKQKNAKKTRQNSYNLSASTLKFKGKTRKQIECSFR